MPIIHPSAFVHESARIHPGTQVGPQAFIDADVEIGPGCQIMHGAHIARWTTLGEGNRVFPGAVLGHEPQDLGYRGEASYTRIGDFNSFREGSTVHRGDREGTETRIGNHNLLMANSHVGHNCRVGNHVILVNGSLLAGFVQVGDRAIISGNCLVHQFVRVGTLAMMRGGSRISKDLPPYCISDEVNWARAINRVGLKRGGFTPEGIRAVKESFKLFFRSGLRQREAIEQIAALYGHLGEVTVFLEFLEGSRRGIVGGRNKIRRTSDETLD